MNHDLMILCDEFLTERLRDREMPHDFDDVTWVMHDFAIWLQERQTQDLIRMLTNRRA